MFVFRCERDIFIDMGLQLGEGKRMWSSVLLEIIFRVIPECLLFIFAGYAFSKYRVQTKRYFMSVLFLFLIGYSINRLLPVEFGITQILVIIACATLLVAISKFPTQKAIASSLGVMILGFITDIASVVIAVLIKGGDIKKVLADKTLFESLYSSPLERQLFGAISLALMAIVLLCIYFMAKAKGNLKDVPIRKSVE